MAEQAWYPDPRAALEKHRAASREAVDALEARDPGQLSAKDATHLVKQALDDYRHRYDEALRGLTTRGVPICR
jgi:hypothetical protein